MSMLFARVIVWKQLMWLLLVVMIPCALILLTSSYYRCFTWK